VKEKAGIVLNASSVLFEGPYGAVKMPTRLLLKSILRSGVSRRNPEADYSSWGPTVELGSLMIMREGFAPAINSFRRAERLLLVEICTCESEL
jgi:hypothetical protein